MITAEQKVETVESWLAGFPAAGVHVLIGSNVPVSRVTLLADVLNAHRLSVSWLVDIPSGTAMMIWPSSTNSVVEEGWPNQSRDCVKTEALR